MAVASRDAAVRGITVPSPEGWSVPEPAERLAAVARANGWAVVGQKWWYNPKDGLQTFFLGIERLLQPGEYPGAAGVGWRYHLVWEEVPEDERSRARMTVRVSRAYTPATGKWLNGPNIKTITDMIVRNPLRLP